jgi:hypothetical protein
MVAGASLTRSVDVRRCPRCGLDHPEWIFFRQTDSSGADIHPLWAGYCPETADPLALARDRENEEKVVAIN